MNNFTRRIISCFLVAVMLMSLYTLPVFAEEGKVLDTDTEHAVDLLNVLEITEVAYNNDLSSKVSRAEFAALITRFTGLYNPVVNADVKFKDVLSGSYDEPYITTVVSSGYMQPVNDEYFYPAWEISALDAARSFLLCLGYGVIAENDSTFHNFANTLDLYDGVDTANFNRGELYKMMYNALMANVMEPTGFGDDVIYEQMKDVTGLYKFHDLIRTSGTITGAGGISLGSGDKSTLEDGMIELDGNRFICDNYDMSTILGREVYLYWRDLHGVKIDVALHIEVIDEQAFTIKADQIIDYNSMSYEYDVEGKSKRISVSAPYVVYNGEEYTGAYTKDIMKPENGDVTVVKNVTGSRDLLIIRSFTDVLVNLVISNDDEQIILGENGERYDVGLYEERVEYYKSNGFAASLSDIKDGSTISVAQSDSGRKTIVWLCPDGISGKITSIETETWTIDDVEYALSPALAKRITLGEEPTPDFDKTYIFHLNLNNEIAFVTEESTALADGIFYAVVTGINTGKGLSTEVALRAYSKKAGGFERYNVADELELNGAKVSRSALVTALMRDGRDGVNTGSFVAQPVKLRLNDNNEVNYIFQAASDNTDGKGFFYFMGSTDPGVKGTYFGYRDILSYSNSGGRDFSNSPKDSGFKTIGVNKRTEYIQVPFFEPVGDAKIGAIDTESEKAFISSTRPTGNSPYVVYKENDDDLTASFVIRATASGEKEHCGTTTNLHCILSITNALVDDEVVIKIKTNKMTYYLDNPNIDLNALKIWDTKGKPEKVEPWIDPETGVQGVHKVVPGDIVNIAADSLGYIKAMEIVYDSVGNKMMGHGTATGESYGYINTETMWFSRNIERNLMLLNVLYIKDGYMSATDARDPATYVEDPTSARHYVAAVPPILCVEESGNKLTTRNAVSSDLVGYYDSPDDYATVILSHRYAQRSGTSFLIKK